MKRFCAAGLVLLFSLPALCFSAEPIKIGVAGAHSGDLAPYGIPSKEAAELVAAAVNAKGGLLGRPLELVIMDDQCKPEIAVNVATSLVSAGVKAVIGHICSGATKAALGIYKESGIPVISPSATTPSLTKSGDYPNFFRTIGADDLQGKFAADYVVNTLKAKRIAVIHDKGDYGKGVADFAKATIESGGQAKVVLYEGITPGAIDYSAVIQKVRREQADAVIYGGYHPEASKLVAIMKKKRVDIPFFGPDGVKGQGFLDIAGKNAEGVYATGPENYAGLSANQAARAAYVKAYGKEPGTFFDQGYAAAQALFDAIRVAGSTDAAAIEKALRSNLVETSIGRIKFDAHGDAEGIGFAVYRVENGNFVEVK
jgi:branched-chain amino acid transport system substrate-binding protein